MQIPKTKIRYGQADNFYNFPFLLVFKYKWQSFKIYLALDRLGRKNCVFNENHHTCLQEGSFVETHRLQLKYISTHQLDNVI